MQINERHTSETKFLDEKHVVQNNLKNNNKLDLLIVIPRTPIIYGGQQLSNGPVVIGSYLQSKGFSIKVFDNNTIYKFYTDDEIIEIINRESPNTVGLSINMLNAFNSYKLLKKIKNKFPEKIVVAGGLHTFDTPNEVAEKGFDITFVGETEISMVKYLKLLNNQSKNIDSKLINNSEFLRDLSLISGLIINNKGRLINTGPYEILTDLDELPILNHDLLNLDDFIKTSSDHHNLTTSLNFQRGCPFKCTYCKADFMGGKVRNNTPDFMIRSIKHIHEKYGQTHFQLSDSNFTINRTRTIEFCNKMISSGLSKKINFWIQTSISKKLRDDDLELLKKAGLARISFGVERFSPEFREFMKKDGTREEVFECLRRITEKGIKTEINILINFPNETKKSLEIESDYLLKALKYVDFFRIHYLIPIPGTEIFENKKVKTKWYLNEKINFKKTSYYDLAFNVTSPGLEFNLFDLSPEVVKANRKFKEKFYIKSLSRLDTNPFLFGSIFFKTILMLDIFVAKISYFLYFYISPTVENILLWPFKMIRESGAKYFIANWFNRREDTEVKITASNSGC